MKDKGWACELIPKSFIVARYFAEEQAELDDLQGQLDAVAAGLTELTEEHGGDEGVLKDVSNKGDAREAYTLALITAWNEDDKAACERYSALMHQAQEHATTLQTLTDHTHISALKNSKGSFTLKAVRDRLAATGDTAEQATLKKYLDADQQQKAGTREAAALLNNIEVHYKGRMTEEPLPEELADLEITVRYLDLLDEQGLLKSKVKEADAALDKMAYDQYPQLSVEDIKTLVVDDKWMAALASDVQEELDRVSQTLTGRIRQLAERYAVPLPQLIDTVAVLSDRVDEHLKRMGAVWI